MNESSTVYKPNLKIKSNRSFSATCCSVVDVLLYGLLGAFTVFYLSYFGYVNGKLKKHGSEHGSDRYCAFFAKSEETLGKPGSCVFFIGGSGVLIGLLLILMILGVFNALCGKWSGCLRGCEVFILLLASVLSLMTNIVMSVGYHSSCHQMKGCNQFTENNLHVKSKMVIIEPVAWVVTCALIILMAIQLVSCVCVCCRKKSSTYTEDHMYDEKALLNSDRAKTVFK